MVEVTCPTCKKAYNVREAVLGKYVRCVGCGGAFIAGSQPDQPRQAGPPRPISRPAPAEQPPARPDPAAAAHPRPAAAAVAVPPQPGPQATMPAPAAAPQPGREFPVKLVAILGGMFMVLLVLGVAAWFVVPWLWGTVFGGLGSMAYYVPSDATSVMSIDVAELRGTELYKEFKDEIEATLASQAGGMKVAGGDIKRLLHVETPKGQLTVVVTRKDLPLKDVVRISAPPPTFGPGEPPRSPAPAKKTHAGVDYVVSGAGMMPIYVARTADATYCASASEKVLQDALDRLDRREKPKFKDDFRKALDRASRHDSYMVFAPPPDEKMDMIKAVGIGFSVGSSISVDGAIIFKNARYAKAFAKLADAAVDVGAAAGEDMADDADRKTATVIRSLLKMIDKIDTSQDGATLEVSWKYKTADAVATAKDAEKNADKLMGVFVKLMPISRRLPVTPPGL